MLDTITGLRWVLFIGGFLALLSTLKYACAAGIILYVIALILAIPGISKIFRPKKPKLAAIVCFISAFILMGIAQGVTDKYGKDPENSAIIITTVEEEESFFAGEDVTVVSSPHLGTITGSETENIPYENTTPVTDINGSEDMILHFIDVGQGDATLVESASKYMLIDMGPIEAADALISYLDAEGVTELERLIITHPHADHVNVTALSQLISRMDIGTVHIPDTTSSTGHALLSYALDVMDEADLDVEITAAGESWTIGNTDVTVLAPNRTNYDELNDYSIVVRLDCGESSAIICADAEEESENDMLLNRRDIQADIIRTGHHGSSTSSGTFFLLDVKPDYAVISCGTDNEYGHPHSEILTNLRLHVGNDIYRTDLHGNIVAVCSQSGDIDWQLEKN